MPRIRSIKPEILSDERSAGLSDGAYRLFTSMIVLADDHGNVRASIPWLTGQIWWAHGSPPRIAEFLREVHEAGLILLYTVRNQPYAHLKSWKKHQRIDNASKPLVPTPQDAEACHLNGLAEIRREPPRNSAGEGEGEGDGKGEREGGEPEGNKPRAEAGAVAPSVASRPRSRKSKPSEPTAEERAAASEVLAKLTARNGVEYRSPEHTKLIAARMREGLDPLDLRKIIAYCADDTGLGWQAKDDMREFLRPATLFGPKTVHRYLDEARAWYAKFVAPQHEAPKPRLELVGAS